MNDSRLKIVKTWATLNVWVGKLCAINDSDTAADKKLYLLMADEKYLLASCNCLVKTRQKDF